MPASDGTLWAQVKSPFPILHLKISGTTAPVIDRVGIALFGSDNIYFMDIDQRGWLWAGSDDSVHVFNGHQWVQCTTADGLLSDDTDLHSFLRTRTDRYGSGSAPGSHICWTQRVSSPLERRRSGLSLHGSETAN